ncbi:MULTISPECIES: signal peptidase I [Streptomyces]|uniref:signal peptidase I n=1 Tax=Streptomyces TaxID=1883 RepID=UPI0007896A48|nr:signal peptidase I [Streptomyces sp. WAC00288]KYG56221.1 S26 family signal peptidase [Streptomyces sp. WAC04657]
MRRVSTQQQSAGRGLRIAAWVLVPLGLVLVLGAVGGIVRGGGLEGERITVGGDAMRPTYSPGERLTVLRVGEGEIRRGDVVLVGVPGRYGNAPVLQRVIGLGGDRVESRDGVRVAVNGKRIDEPYVMRDPLGSAGAPYDVTVPEGRLFLLGDNRPVANDSRSFLDEQSGSVAASDVRGRVRAEGAVPLALWALAAFGALLALVGIGSGVRGYTTRRRP